MNKLLFNICQIKKIEFYKIINNLIIYFIYCIFISNISTVNIIISNIITIFNIIPR